MIPRFLWMAVVGLLLAPTLAAAQDEVVYYHTDAIGSVRMVTDASGVVLARYDYLPFGERWDDPPNANPDVRQFTGKERDPETDLDYFGARYMRAQSGRFTTVDPVLNVDASLVDPQRWNRYSYAANRPTTMTDPDGREPTLLTGAIGAAVMGGWQALSNVYYQRPWHENVGVQAGVGFAVGFTLGFAAPALATTAPAITTATTVATTAATAAMRAAQSDAVGKTREAIVAEISGGRIVNDLKITLHGVGSTAVDIIGPAGELIGVGGGAKGFNLSTFGTKLKILSEVAQQRGVTAQYYLERLGTPQEAIGLAEKWLGKGNVILF